MDGLKSAADESQKEAGQMLTCLKWITFLVYFRGTRKEAEPLMTGTAVLICCY